MNIHNNVIWSEGMFIRPQHFQQQERYFKYLLHNTQKLSKSFYWGFEYYTINHSFLSMGKIGLDQAKGMFPDGTLFSFPDQDSLPPALDIDETVRDQLVYLCLPISRNGLTEIAINNNNLPLARTDSYETMVIDNTTDGLPQANLLLGKLMPRLLLESQDRSQYVCLPLAKIKESRSDQQILLDEQFIPPCITVNASPELCRFLQEVTALLEQRSIVLAERIGPINHHSTTTSVISDFLLLQQINRFVPIFKHLQQRSITHPEQFYLLLLDLLGNLSVFKQNKKTNEHVPIYKHDDLAQTYLPLMTELRQALNLVVEPTAIAIPLQQQKFGIEVATLHDRSLFKDGNFILAVHADTTNEHIRGRFAATAKIGPVEQMRQLINLQLPGISLQTLAVAPPQIPYNVRYVYFELLQQGELWQQLKNSAGIAIHAGGDFSGLKMELWVIRN